MNVFEDLLEELQEENLLETTIIGVSGRSEKAAPEAAVSDLPEYSDLPDTPLVSPIAEPPTPAIFNEPVSLVEEGTVETADLQLMGDEETIQIRKASSEREFYRKRANAEVMGLQMVGHILTAVEREQLKKLSVPYDDLNAKKALHTFLQVEGPPSSDEHKEAEFNLMQETESWCSALAVRDREISVAALRRYCETCRPMLSSQAMLSLGKFYRNLPYSEAVGAKFDFIITRLFSIAAEDETRKLLFSESDMLGHIKTLYAEWSSVPLYNADEEAKTDLIVRSFHELSEEAESAISFDDLIRSDFFGRVRIFKESVAEIFFAPQVTVAAVECNIRVGNAYVNLIDRERRAAGAASTHDKYGFLDEQEISEAAGRSLELTELLHYLSEGRVNEPAELAEMEPEKLETPETDLQAAEDEPKAGLARVIETIFGINKIILIATIVLIPLSVGLYFWTAGEEEVVVSTADVRVADISDVPYFENFKQAKVSGDMLYGVMLPNWDTMPKEKRLDLVRSVQQAGAEKGWVNVTLVNTQGINVAYATPAHAELIEK